MSDHLKSGAGWGPRVESPGIQQFARVWTYLEDEGKRKDRCRKGDHKTAPHQLHLFADHASHWLWLSLGLVSGSCQFFCRATSLLQASLSHRERRCHLPSQVSLGHRLVPWKAFSLFSGTDFLKPSQFCQAFSYTCCLCWAGLGAPVLRTWWKRGGKSFITISCALP